MLMEINYELIIKYLSTNKWDLKKFKESFLSKNRKWSCRNWGSYC